MAVATPYVGELNYREILADSLAEFLKCACNLWNEGAVTPRSVGKLIRRERYELSRLLYYRLLS
jgi:hypothetical protein